MTTYSITI